MYEQQDPVFAEKLTMSLYVDDLVTGGKEAEDVVELYRKTSDRMASGGFKLRKWLTNDPEIRESIMTNEDRANESQGSLPDDESYAKSSFATGRKWALVEGTTMANRARGSVARSGSHTSR